MPVMHISVDGKHGTLKAKNAAARRFRGGHSSSFRQEERIKMLDPAEDLQYQDIRNKLRGVMYVCVGTTWRLKSRSKEAMVRVLHGYGRAFRWEVPKDYVGYVLADRWTRANRRRTAWEAGQTLPGYSAADKLADAALHRWIVYLSVSPKEAALAKTVCTFQPSLDCYDLSHELSKFYGGAERDQHGTMQAIADKVSTVGSVASRIISGMTG